MYPMSEEEREQQQRRLKKYLWDILRKPYGIYLRTWEGGSLHEPAKAWTVFVYWKDRKLPKMPSTGYETNAFLKKVERMPEPPMVRAVVREVVGGFFIWDAEEMLSEFDDLDVKPKAPKGVRVYQAEVPVRGLRKRLKEAEKFSIPIFDSPPAVSAFIYDITATGLSLPWQAKLIWEVPPHSWGELSSWTSNLQKFLHECVERGQKLSGSG